MLFSRWITPEVVSRRFDAWFFLALAPAHTPPRPDGVETTDAGWFEPAGALEAQAAGEIALAFPTIKQLEALLPFRSSDEALEAHRELAVEPILPKVIGTPRTTGSSSPAIPTTRPEAQNWRLLRAVTLAVEQSVFGQVLGRGGRLPDRRAVAVVVFDAARGAGGAQRQHDRAAFEGRATTR